MKFLKTFFDNRRRKKADVQFRSGFLYAIDRRLFCDSDPLIPKHDLDSAMRTASFASGYRAGLSHRFEVFALQAAERERRVACDSV